MKLEIANQAELEAACKAVEELRSCPQVRHTRLLSFRESAFALGWQRVNQMSAAYIYNRRNVLDLLLCMNEEGNNFVRTLKPEEETAADAVIQWLGSDDGFTHLCGWLTTAGYEVRKERGLI